MLSFFSLSVCLFTISINFQGAFSTTLSVRWILTEFISLSHVPYFSGAKPPELKAFFVVLKPTFTYPHNCISIRKMAGA